ncbi:MAG: DUF294 nucleotidyltransferase-like domain-containing protein, partial [Desulfuromonadaceae bacterium]|nr:DUF294 nucleotidyltransferase-like domain-containing protein [Desulfuromonadaceae bacterium]
HEDSLFFIPVEDICRHKVVTCSPDMPLVEMAKMMMTNNISGIVVTLNNEPVGIVSLRDLRNLIAESAADIPEMLVSDIMKTRLISIKTSDHLFKAIFLMSKHNIHRLIVVDQNNKLSGILTDTDLLRIQTRSPLYLVQEIESAVTIEQLKLIGKKMTEMLKYAVSTNADAHSLIQLIAHFNDAFTERLIHILDVYHDIRLPEGAAYLAMGSEGRGEQTLRTDQDSAIVYRDDLIPVKQAQIQLFASRIVASLEAVGIPLCPGNMMANNPDWCHSISEWKRLTSEWISNPTPENTVFFGVFQDIRVLHGDTSFENELRSHIIDYVRHNSVFLPLMARNIVRFKPPLGIFGRLLVEKKGEAKGKIDLKKGGLFTLTRGIGLIALEAGIMGGSIWDKLTRLHSLNIISDHDLETLTESFTFLIRLRLVKQLISASSGSEPNNLVDPLVLRDNERDKLRAAFKGVNTLIGIMHSRYKLDMIAR